MGDDVRIERSLAASPERVYAAWTDPALLNRWYCPNPELPLEVTGDAVVGGTYRVDMADGRYVAEGVYTALEPGRVVEFTWSWSTEPDPTTSRVRVEIAPDGAGVRLVLVHSGLAGADDVDGHREGWGLALDRLAALG